MRHPGASAKPTSVQRTGSTPLCALCPPICSESRTLLSKDTGRLHAFHIRCQRQILRIRWFNHVTNKAIAKHTGLSPITDFITRRPITLFERVARLDSHVPAYCALASAVNRRTERRAPNGWEKLPGRPQRTLVQQIGNGSTSSILNEWNAATGRGHSSRATRSALRVIVAHAT